MSDPEEGQHIEKSRLICGRVSVTSSVRRARQNVHIQNSGRGRGQMAGGEDTSQATQPTQSHVDDLSQYLNYHDQVHDATGGGYDDEHIPDDVVPILDADDIAAQTTPQVLPDQPPFPSGPLDTTLLSSYVEHVALRLWYNSNNVSVIFNCLKLLYAILKKYYINIFFFCFKLARVISI